MIKFILQKILKAKHLYKFVGLRIENLRIWEGFWRRLILFYLNVVKESDSNSL